MRRLTAKQFTEILSNLLLESADLSDGETVEIEQVSGSISANYLEVTINGQLFELTIKEVGKYYAK